MLGLEMGRMAKEGVSLMGGKYVFFLAAPGWVGELLIRYVVTCKKTGGDRHSERSVGLGGPCKYHTLFGK